MRPKCQTPVDVVTGRSETERPLNERCIPQSHSLDYYYHAESGKKEGILFLSPVWIIRRLHLARGTEEMNAGMHKEEEGR